MTNEVSTTDSFLTDKKTEKKFYRKLFWRQNWLMFCTSYTKQQAVTYSWVLEPFLAKIYGKDTPEFYSAMLRHQTFFNTTPMMAPFVMSLNLSMERENHDSKGKFDSSSITAIKSALMGPFAGLGDSVQQGALRIIATGVAIGLCKKGMWLGPLLFLLIYNIPNMLIRWYGAKLGYRLGQDFVTKAMENGIFKIITKAVSVLGLMMIGAMSAQYVSFTTTFQTKAAGQVFKLQSVLDQILPGLLPLALVLCCFWYLRKKNRPARLLVVIVVLALVLTFLGITGGAA
ncbi:MULTISPECIES: PTS system mannose/fructose/sorbose family transporter subunit IID [unclassified Companilactobacillus]|jgi:PTS system mannose-specific IID component|uniref:PTS system mannose/fructose/sorbose family transporter subunit IID n=1 Tax=unclassified Companilactobacillus TaxID=2767904 RepID=UPI002FF1DEFD